MGVGCAKLIEEHSKTLLHNSSNKVMVSISRRKLGNSIEKLQNERTSPKLIEETNLHG